jgi:FkbM family methyltransferase
MRRGTLRIAAGPAKGLLIELSGSRPSYALGSAEPEVAAMLCAHLRPGDVVFDLGANIGYFTLVAARLVGEKGRVIAYEPVPHNATALRRNVLLNELINVEVIEAALDDSDGETRLAMARSDQQASLEYARSQHYVTVRTVRLSSEVERLGSPTLIKCDIEGSEYRVFAGAGPALDKVQTIICEVHQTRDGDHERFASLLSDIGFLVEWMAFEPTGWTSHLLAKRA